MGGRDRELCESGKMLQQPTDWSGLKPQANPLPTLIETNGPSEPTNCCRPIARNSLRPASRPRTHRPLGHRQRWGQRPRTKTRSLAQVPAIRLPPRELSPRRSALVGAPQQGQPPQPPPVQHQVLKCAGRMLGYRWVRVVFHHPRPPQVPRWIQTHSLIPHRPQIWLMRWWWCPLAQFPQQERKANAFEEPETPGPPPLRSRILLRVPK